MKILAQEIKKQYAAYHGDNIEVIKPIPDNSVHYIMFSPPFAELFTYSNSERDMGNSKGMVEFITHIDYLVNDLFRILMPGRLLSFHCMDLLATITKDGYIGLKDFPGILLKIFEQAGFVYHSKVTIWKDPLIQAVRTKVLSLAHKQISKDSTRCGVGCADYIVTVVKLGSNPEPVAHGRGFERYIGDRPEPKAAKTDIARDNKYSHEVWQRYASPVWMDINQTNTLNLQAARDQNDEKHICPLQLDTIARCLELWTNEGDTVVDPFSGLMSVGYQALLMNRRPVMIELKESYYKQGLKNLRRAIKPTTKKYF